MKIMLSCAKINNKEWSGRLYYKINSVADDLSKIELETVDLLVLDVGIPAYTEYVADSRTTTYMMSNLELMQTKMAHIHSHQNFGVFFSPTDVKELHFNAKNFDFYLSVIVNNNFDVQAKAVFKLQAKEEVRSIPGEVRALGVKLPIDQDVVVTEQLIVKDVNVLYDDVFDQAGIHANVTDHAAIAAKKKEAERLSNIQPDLYRRGVSMHVAHRSDNDMYNGIFEGAAELAMQNEAQDYADIYDTEELLRLIVLSFFDASLDLNFEHYEGFNAIEEILETEIENTMGDTSTSSIQDYSELLNIDIDYKVAHAFDAHIQEDERAETVEFMLRIVENVYDTNSLEAYEPIFEVVRTALTDYRDTRTSLPEDTATIH